MYILGLKNKVFEKCISNMYTVILFALFELLCSSISFTFSVKKSTLAAAYTLRLPYSKGNEGTNGIEEVNHHNYYIYRLASVNLIIVVLLFSVTGWRVRSYKSKKRAKNKEMEDWERDGGETGRQKKMKNFAPRYRSCYH